MIAVDYDLPIAISARAALPYPATGAAFNFCLKAGEQGSHFQWELFDAHAVTARRTAMLAWNAPPLTISGSRQRRHQRLPPPSA